MNIDTDKLTRRLSKVKSNLILDHTFIGTLVLNMPFILDENVPTAETNGQWVKFNPEYIMPMSDSELLFLVSHEVFHPMFSHNYRRHERDPQKWNIACDYVVNQLLIDEGIGTMLEGVCYNPDLYKAGGGTSDGIFNLLPDSAGSGNGFQGSGYGGEGQALDDCQDHGGSEAEVAQAEAEMKVKVAQAAQAARIRGKLSANMERLVGEILPAKVNWREVLRRFLTRCKSDDRSFARPARRFIPRGLYMPTADGEAMGELLFAVDCSGSISPRQVDQFAGEIRAVKEELTPTRIHVVYFDSEVSHCESYGPDDELDIRPHGGGGTAFSPVFRYAEEHGIEPVACVFLTDLYCNDFGEAPEYPVLWVSTHADQAPFGEVVKMEETN